MRIVTLLPSATEIVCALGRTDDLVGVSHGCNYPRAVQCLPSMTSTRVPVNAESTAIDEFVREHLASNAALYDLDIDALALARPDVVVSQGLCDVCAVATGDVVEAVCSLPTKPSLIDLVPNTLQDVLDDVLRVGRAIDAVAESEQLVAELIGRRDAVAARSARISPSERPTVAFLEWLLPPFNGGHWNPELVDIAGGIDVLGHPGRPSRSLDLADVAAADPDVLFVACCGFDRRRALDDVALLGDRDEWQSLRAVRNGEIHVADGSAYFASPGPRLLDGLEMLAHALHPEVHPPAAAGICHRVR